MVLTEEESVGACSGLMLSTLGTNAICFLFPSTACSGLGLFYLLACHLQHNGRRSQHFYCKISSVLMQRLQQLAGQSDPSEAALRISVDSGGCSGFQYKFELDDQSRPHDRWSLL